VAARCRAIFPDAVTDEEAIGKACDRSSFFCGLYKLLDVEIRLAVQPFVRWEQGDFSVFLKALPAMCALVASGRKPKVNIKRLSFILCYNLDVTSQVSKVMLMLVERMNLYLSEHPNAVKHLAANCTLFDEEKI
jgi:hypothetical protein